MAPHIYAFTWHQEGHKAWRDIFYQYRAGEDIAENLIQQALLIFQMLYLQLG
jgi:hypothetical protein